jgi:DNA polymerase III subunit beta
LTAIGAERVVTDGRVIQATTKDSVFASKLIDGTFPDWRRVVPEASSNSAEFSVAEMLAALARMQAFANKEDTQKKGGVCKLSWSANSDVLTIRLKADAAEDVVAAAVGGLDGEFACSIRYLTESLKNLNSKRAVLNSESPTSPVRISTPEKDDVLGVVMPMRW